MVLGSGIKRALRMRDSPPMHARWRTLTPSSPRASQIELRAQGSKGGVLGDSTHKKLPRLRNHASQDKTYPSDLTLTLFFWP